METNERHLKQTGYFLDKERNLDALLFRVQYMLDKWYNKNKIIKFKKSENSTSTFEKGHKAKVINFKQDGLVEIKLNKDNFTEEEIMEIILDRQIAQREKKKLQRKEESIMKLMDKIPGMPENYEGDNPISRMQHYEKLCGQSSHMTFQYMFLQEYKKWCADNNLSYEDAEE